MSKFTRLFCCGAALLVLGVSFAAAQEEENAAGLSDELNAVATLDESAANPAEMPDLTIPENAKPAELLAFVEGLERKFPQPTSEEEAIEMIGKITELYLQIADRVLADSSATDDEKHQASELKVVAYMAKSQTGDESAAGELDKMITSMIADAKTDEEKIQAYQMKLQTVAAAAQADPASFDKVSALADEILANKDSEELQVFGLEVKAQEAFTRSRAEEGKVEEFVEFLNGYLANAEISQRAREKAFELKLAALLILTQSDESKEADYEACFDEVLASPLSPETRKTVYQMRVQSLMAGNGGQPGPQQNLTPEALAKLDAVAEKLMKEDSDELQAMGYAVKAANLLQKAQEDPAQIDELFAFADANLAGEPSETLKTQMIGLKVQGYALKIQQEPEAAKEMLAFLDEQIAAASDEMKTRLVTVKLQILSLQLQSDFSYAEELEKVLNEMKDAEGVERVLQSCWGALYIAKIQNLADNGGSLDDFNTLFAQIKEKMAEMPLLGFLVGNAKDSIEQIGKKNGDDNLVARVFQEMIELENGSENPMAKQVAVSLQGILDQMNLKGSSLAIEGIRVGTSEKYSTADLSGKYFLVDVWSARDQGYFETLEELTALYSDFSAKGFEIVGINTDEKNDSLERAVDVLGMTWPVLSTALSREAELEALPEALSSLPPGAKVLVGPDGNVAVIDDLAGIRAYLVEKLGEPEAAPADADETAAESEEEK